MRTIRVIGSPALRKYSIAGVTNKSGRNDVSHNDLLVLGNLMQHWETWDQVIPDAESMDDNSFPITL